MEEKKKNFKQVVNDNLPLVLLGTVAAVSVGFCLYQRARIASLNSQLVRSDKTSACLIKEIQDLTYHLGKKSFENELLNSSN